jgi:GNAT superfamily N-acetyltransferase
MSAQSDADVVTLRRTGYLARYVRSVFATIVTLAERPDLAAAVRSMPNTWPEFMVNDPVAEVFLPQLAHVFPEHQLVSLDETGTVVGKVHSVPFAWTGLDADLPERGWEAIVERAFVADRNNPPTAVSLLEAQVVPAERGRGLSAVLLQAARGNVQRLGIEHLFGPVRPTGKSSEPRTPMSQYVGRLRGDGLPVDPWLRVHARLGARVVKICPVSMTVAANLQRWREWTGLPLRTSGLVGVPGALTPVHVSVEHDHAVYVEPNVWMHHRVAADEVRRELPLR